MLEENFLKKLSLKYQDYEEDSSIIECAKLFATLNYREFSFKECPLEKTIIIIRSILESINLEYLHLFDQMYQEEDSNKPIIYIFDSNNKVEQNESLSYYHEIYFYKTNALADIYLLLHEFTHILINREDNYSSDKTNNEIAPILSEFIVSSILKDNNYLIQRLNSIIKESKSITLKHHILNGNYNLLELYEKYNMSEEEIKEFEQDLLYSKKLSYEDEKAYLKGFIYAYYYSNNMIDNYKELVERLTLSRKIELPEININNFNKLIKRKSSLL